MGNDAFSWGTYKVSEIENAVNIIGSVFSIITGVMAVVSWIKGNVKSGIVFLVVAVGVAAWMFYKNKASVGIIIVSVASVAILFAVIRVLKLAHKSSLYRCISYFFTKKDQYILKERRIYYEYTDLEHIEHRKEFDVYTRNDSFELFTDRYVFSGETKCKLNPSPSDLKIVDEHIDHGWNFYSIMLNSPVPKHSVVHVGMKMDTIEDKNHTAKPYLSTGIYEATQSLKMTIKFGEGLTPSNPKLKIYKDYTDRTPVEERALQFDASKRIIEYIESYPMYHYKYLVSWSFESGKQ